MLAPRKRNARKGFTLVEVLTVMGVTVALSALIVQTLFRSRDAVDHTVDKVEAVQSARQVVDTLTPLVAVTASPPAGGFRPVTINLPETDDGLSPTSLDLVTTENFLGEEFAGNKREFIPLDELRSFFYRVEYEPEGGRLILRKMMDTDPSTADPRVSPKLLASGIDGLIFRPLVNNDSVVEVYVRVKQRENARNAGKNQLVESSATLAIPYYSLR